MATFDSVNRLAVPRVPKVNYVTASAVGRGAAISAPPRIPSLVGTGRIYGSTYNKGAPSNLPVGRRVRCIREFDGVFVEDVWSDSTTGAFSVTNLNSDYTYTVTFYDHTGQYDPETRGPLSPVPM